MNRRLDEIKQKLDEARINFDVKVAHLERLVETKIDSQIDNSSNKKPPSCPVCFEYMTSETKIAQCNRGHLLCWSCKEKMEMKNCQFCGTCGLPLDGRAFDMESYLKYFFNLSR